MQSVQLDVRVHRPTVLGEGERFAETVLVTPRITGALPQRAAEIGRAHV